MRRESTGMLSRLRSERMPSSHRPGEDRSADGDDKPPGQDPQTARTVSYVTAPGKFLSNTKERR